MSKDKRALVQAALARTNSSTTQVAAPTKAMGQLDERTEGKIDADKNLHQLKQSLAKANVELNDYLTEQLGIKLSKPTRTLTTPSGEQYTVASTHLTYEQLVELCVIDEDNVRDESERTEEALSDIIEEIGMGFQLMPIIAYINDEGKNSIIEGSRRTAAAIIRKTGLDVDILDRKPGESTIRWMVAASDKKKSFSYYEKGELYCKLMQTHKWSKADLERERGYNQADISVSVGFYSAPKEILSLLPVKSIPQTYVKKFNRATSLILEKNALSEAITMLQERTLGIEVLPSIAQAKRIVDVWNEVSENLSSIKAKTKKPEFSYGEAKAYVTRTKKGANIKIDAVPKALEQEVLAAIEKVLRSQ
ncbi:ParB N-terminal domain-containing protein [Vibrio aestuarianus subsp. cardii]|uniref:ParB N-terminal domain-containing protein n=1 Tax=Vibrio aestuarianus TaxID=28171 RepID=UPI001558CDA1|nr:ParB N-terminal domain-containing protein [Vibrio aestuarianus]NGZ66601.1 ParB N-terminal domain-containing protein [Vibrio aestuarianus subsp. cardii]